MQHFQSNFDLSQLPELGVNLLHELIHELRREVCLASRISLLSNQFQGDIQVLNPFRICLHFACVVQYLKILV